MHDMMNTIIVEKYGSTVPKEQILFYLVFKKVVL
jgi:hypothetical protein